MQASAPAVLILAAGKGTRMKSARPKVMHELLGRSLIGYVLNSARYLNPAKVVIVTGHGREEVEKGILETLPEKSAGQQSLPKPDFVHQDQQLGTGHAVSMAKDLLADYQGPLVIMAGDVPLVSPETLLDFVAAHQALEAKLSVLTVKIEDPASYGRVIRDENGWLEKIVEAKDASDNELLVDEINSGFYVASAPELYEAIGRLKNNNKQGEYYLPDVVLDFRQQDLKVAAILGPDPLEVSGINDRYELAGVGAVLKDRINSAWMKAGVTMQDPFTTYIEAGVRLAQDVTLGPGVVLAGRTKIAEGAEIGAHCYLANCQIGQNAKIGANSSLSGQTVAPGEKLKPGTCLA